MTHEDEKVEICRLCGKESQNYISIFQDKDNILEKIRCLPIDISPNDKLPSNVCGRCSNHLNISYELRCTAVEVDKHLRMQLDQRQTDAVCKNKDTNKILENFSNIKREIIDEVPHYQNDTQEIRDKKNIYNDWKIEREDIDEISCEKEAVTSTEDNETLVNLVTELDIVEMKYEDVMGVLIEQTDKRHSDIVTNKTTEDCQKFPGLKMLEQNKQSFYCKTCNINFEKERYFKAHNQIHEKKTVICTKCSKNYPSLYDLFFHKRKKHNMHKKIQLKYTCIKCDKFFTHSSSWKNHNKNKCSTINSCPICHKSFRAYDLKRNHMKREHKKEEFMCNDCKKCFRYKSDLDNHILMHLPVEARKYHCDICQKKFITNSYLTRHKRLHSGVRPYKCDVCSSSFNHLGNMKRHRTQHFRKKNFVCDYCGKCFSLIRDLRTHILTHLPVQARKYQCDICEKIFTTSCELTRHKRIHSGVRPYKCDVCSFRFNDLGNMKRHRMRHFKNEDKHARNTLLKN